MQTEYDMAVTATAHSAIAAKKMRRDRSLPREHDRFSDHAPAIIVIGSPAPAGTTPTPTRTAPAPAPRRTGKGEDAATRSYPYSVSRPDPPATPSAANQRGLLDVAVTGGREAEFRRLCARHRGCPIGRCTERKQSYRYGCGCKYSFFAHACPPYVSGRTEAGVRRCTPQFVNAAFGGCFVCAVRHNCKTSSPLTAIRSLTIPRGLAH
jgi:hypothetical protein